MKKITVALLAAVLCLTAVGCAKKTTTATPPPPGAINSTDATINEALQPIHAFVASMVSQSNAGTVTLTANQKALLNKLVTDVNAADTLYQAWHAAGGAGSTTQINAAITTAQGDQTALNAAIQGGK
jgi:hypothetical protein